MKDKIHFSYLEVVIIVFVLGIAARTITLKQAAKRRFPTWLRDLK